MKSVKKALRNNGKEYTCVNVKKKEVTGSE